MHDRRHFLRLSIAGTNALLLSTYLRGCGMSLSGSLNYGLFTDASRLKTLRELYAADPSFAALREKFSSIDRAAERKFLESEVRYNDHLYDIVRVSNAAQQMAFHYLMTEDVDAANLSVQALRTLMKFPKWDYFLEGGTDVLGIQRASSSVVAVALASDWLGGHITEEERSEWLDIMGERGCDACFRSIYGMRYPDRVVGWSMDRTSTYLEHRPGDIIDLRNWPYILNATNLKAVPASALVIGTIAYEQQFGRSEKVDRWLEQGLFSIDSFRDLFAPDGSYNEGVSYANYTTSHLIQAIDLVKRFRGEDHYDIIDWDGYIDFLYGMSMPTNDDPHAIVNISDAGTGVISSVPYYIAGRDSNGTAKWFGDNLARDHDEWSLMWFPGSVAAEPPADNVNLWKSDLDWISARTGYRPEDLVVAMRSGGPANHEHADRNSIMIKCFGEKLVVDPYRPPYSYSDPSWILRTTVGHSAILIDGIGHQYHDGSEGTNASDAAAEIVSMSDTEQGMQWTSDATPAYKLANPNVNFVSRSVAVDPDTNVVVVVDKVKTARPSKVTARFYADNTDGKATVERSDASGFAITRPGASIRSVSVALSGVEVRSETLDIPAEVAVLHPFADVETKTRATESLLITALLPSKTGGEPLVPTIERDGGRYLVQASGATICTIENSTEYPTITFAG